MDHALRMLDSAVAMILAGPASDSLCAERGIGDPAALAYHEAAHAVVGHVRQGRIPGRISIVGDEYARGRVTFAPASATLQEACKMAAPIGRPQPSPTDRQAAILNCYALAGGFRGARDWYRTKLFEARGLLLCSWPLVEAVAAELLQKRVLDACDFYRIGGQLHDRRLAELQRAAG